MKIVAGVMMKKMRREAKKQITVGHIIKSLGLYCNYEVKQTTKEYLNIKQVEDKQIKALLSGEVSGIHWKYSDQDQRIKPFDGSNNPPLPGYIIIKYPKAFTLIRVQKFLDETKELKSLSFSKASEIAEYIVD